MELHRSEPGVAVLGTSVEELTAIANALNEVLHALDIAEFHPRLGVSRETIASLFEQIKDVIAQLAPPAEGKG